MFDNVFEGRKVFITGHTGFKGSWLCQWLLNLGAEVTGYSSYVPDPAHFSELGLEKYIKHVQGDVRDYKALQKAISESKPEIVLHLAAQALVRLSYEDPRTTFETNLMGTVNVLDILRSQPSVRAAVMVTSDKCYENVEQVEGYLETDRLGGKDPYSGSKACAEIAASSYLRSFFDGSGAQISTARAGNVIGGGDWAKDRIVPDCVRAWARGEPALLRSPQSTRPWQHVLEPLSGYLWLAAKLYRSGKSIHQEAFNFGPDASTNHPVLKLVEEMSKTWPSVRWNIDPSANKGKPEAGLLQLNCEKALKELKWNATLNFEETMQMTAEWYRSFEMENAPAVLLTERQIAKYQSLARERGLEWATN